MPAPTDMLAEQIVVTNQELADTNRSVRDLSTKFDQFRVDIATQFGTLNANFEAFRARTENTLAVVTWTARIAIPIVVTIVIGLIAWSYSAFERAVKLEASITRLESSTKQLEASTKQLEVSTKQLEASVVELREHAKEVDQRIARIAELIAPRK